jgi:hypothetical protein
VAQRCREFLLGPDSKGHPTRCFQIRRRLNWSPDLGPLAKV